MVEPRSAGRHLRDARQLLLVVAGAFLSGHGTVGLESAWCSGTKRSSPMRSFIPLQSSSCEWFWTIVRYPDIGEDPPARTQDAEPRSLDAFCNAITAAAAAAAPTS